MNSRDPISADIDQRLLHTVGVRTENADAHHYMRALSQVAREHLAERWVETQEEDKRQRGRRIYYMSMEFLIGRTLRNALSALDLHDHAAAALSSRGKKLDDALEHEPDAGLGNGGLGRLAACFLDSMATLGLPSWGYGMRYEYGMFAQSIHDGIQVEHPDPWLADGTPWEFPRHEADQVVSFGGWVDRSSGHPIWRAGDSVVAKAYDMVVPGHGTRRVSTLRLWKATAPVHIDLQAFNQGDYARAAEFKNRFENISWVLYPNDSTPAGRELRLRQEYFFVAASVQDILARHLQEHGTLHNLADHVAIHLNDTHPAIAVPELMRLLQDEHGMAWQEAWSQCERVFSYTNHTLMPEALESWPLGLIQHVLPRHLEIVLDINHHLIEKAAAFRPGDGDFLRRISLIDESGERRIRMAHLCIFGSHKINGVSKLHSELMQQTIFADFARLFPQRFTNKTNGVTPRRWLAQANPNLGALLDRRIGIRWRTNLDELVNLKPLARDPEFAAEFAAVKLGNKRRLARHLADTLGIEADPNSLFDVHIKRIHEYKRQLLNILHVVTRYNTLLRDPSQAQVARTVVFAGKAASSYHMAKLIIRLIHDVAHVINNDARIGGRLKVAFIPNYGVSVAELIVTAADLSEQISTAGTEASGTGNMKLALNGALTIGTMDGANIEICDSVGAENIFLFGHSAAQIGALRHSGYHPRRYYEEDERLREVIDQIDGGLFSPDEPDRFRAITDALLWHGDHYMLLADYASYIDTQKRVDLLYRDVGAWTRTAAINVAGMGAFSADRTIREYADEIWRIAPQS